MLSINKARRYLLLHGLCVPSVKTTTYVCNRFNTSFCARDCKAISNLNESFETNQPKKSNHDFFDQSLF